MSHVCKVCSNVGVFVNYKNLYISMLQFSLACSGVWQTETSNKEKHKKQGQQMQFI